MKFRAFKTFRKVSTDVAEVVLYLRNELAVTLSELQTGLNKLGLDENFEGFIYDGAIAANTEIAIRNKLDTIPRYRVILKSTLYEIQDGATEWTQDFVYIKNANATTEASVKILFLK